VHLRSLTSLRFFAAAVVVLYHAAAFSGLLTSVRPLFGLGYVGVTFFFVLSGFVLAWTAREGDRVSHFYARRFARVWPLTALSIVVAFGVVALEHGEQSPVRLLGSLFLLQAWVPQSTWYFGYNGVVWSLSAEAFFYALFPLLIMLLRRTRRPTAVALGTFLVGVLAAVVVIASAPLLSRTLGHGTSADWRLYLLYITPPVRFCEFAVGAALAVAMRRGWRPPLSLRTSAILTLAAYAVMSVVAAVQSDWTRFPHGISDLVLLVPISALICAAAAGDLADQTPRWLASRSMVRLGQWSFALYLFHQLMLRLVLPHFDGGTGERTAALVLTIVGSVILAGVLHEHVEKPVETLFRRRLGRGDQRALVVPADSRSDVASYPPPLVPVSR